MNDFQSRTPSGILAGRSILVVEDQALLADLAEEILLGAGASHVLVALNLAQAIKHLDGPVRPDAAMVDLDLSGGAGIGSGKQLAETLLRRGIPFFFATAYEPGSIAAELRTIPVLPKPYTPEMLITILVRVLAAKAPV